MNSLTLWVAAERLPQFKSIYPSASLSRRSSRRKVLRKSPGPLKTRWSKSCAAGWKDLVRSQLKHWLSSFGLSKREIEIGLLKLEAEGFVIRGKFTPGTTETEWCARRLLARIHSYTLNRLRQEIEPVATADFMRFLLAWQKARARSSDGRSGKCARHHRAAGRLRSAGGSLGRRTSAQLVWSNTIRPGSMLCVLSGEVVWAQADSACTRSRNSAENGTNERAAPRRCATLRSRSCGARILRSGIRCFRSRR